MIGGRAPGAGRCEGITMSIGAQGVSEVARNGGDHQAGVHGDELRQLTAGRYAYAASTAECSARDSGC